MSTSVKSTISASEPASEPGQSSVLSGWSDRGALTLLTAAYILLHAAIAFAIPKYEPATQNDDWVYAMPIQAALDGEGFYLHPNTGALALPQMAAGWALCAAVGQFSYGLLRWAMVIGGVAPVLLSYAMLRQTQLSVGRAVVGAFLVLVNPWLVILTWSFQTDVVFLTFVLAAVTAALRFEGDASRRSWLVASLVALLMACLTRQSGIFVALALAAYLGTNRKYLPAIAYLLLIPICMAVERYFVAQGDLTYLPYAKETLIRELTSAPLLRSFLAGYEALHMFAVLGLFALPILIAVFQSKRLRWISLALPSALLAGMLFLDSQTQQTIFPGNYLSVSPHLALGPRTLAISTDPNAAVGLVSEPWSWALKTATALGVLGGAVLLALFLRDAKEMLRRVRKRSLIPSDATLLTFALLFASLFLISTFIGRRPFDKYLLSVFPLILPMALARCDGDWKVIRFSAPVVVLLFAVSYAGVVDYWSWNAARWQAVAWLESNGTPPIQIDGGYEFNGMHGTLAMPPGMKLSSRHRGPVTPTATQTAVDFYTVRNGDDATHAAGEVHSVPYHSILRWSELRVVVTRDTKGPVAQSAPDELRR